MRTRARLASLIVLLLGAATPARADPTLNVVELFQSQGCSSCPPANANVMALADRPDVLALSFGVTYWDYLGWKDTFASPAFTARQRDYVRGLHGASAYTPQVVVNGRVELVGTDRAQLEQTIRRNVRPPFEPAITFAARRVNIGAGRGGAADVWLVWYDPRTLNIPIRRGENGGRTLPHRNVARAITRLGGWTGAEEAYDLPPPPDAAYRGAILLQRPDGGPILAAARID